MRFNPYVAKEPTPDGIVQFKPPSFVSMLSSFLSADVILDAVLEELTSDNSDELEGKWA